MCQSRRERKKKKNLSKRRQINTHQTMKEKLSFTTVTAKYHFKSSCPQNKRSGKGNKSHFQKEFADVTLASDSYESVGVLVTFSSNT